MSSNQEDYEIISNENLIIKDMEKKLKEKDVMISELINHFRDFGIQISKKIDDVGDRIQVIKINEEEPKKLNWLKEAYLNDLEDFRATLRNLLFYKESVEQTYKVEKK